VLVRHAKYVKNQGKGEYVSGQTHETTIENFDSSGSDSLMCQEKKTHQFAIPLGSPIYTRSGGYRQQTSKI